MSPKWPIGFLMAGMILSFFAAVGDLLWIGDVSYTTPILVLLDPFSNGPIVLFRALRDIVTFNYPFFSGPWELVRWMLFIGIGAGFLITLLINLLQGAGSTIGGIFRAR